MPRRCGGRVGRRGCRGFVGAGGAGAGGVVGGAGVAGGAGGRCGSFGRICFGGSVTAAHSSIQQIEFGSGSVMGRSFLFGLIPTRVGVRCGGNSSCAIGGDRFGDQTSQIFDFDTTVIPGIFGPQLFNDVLRQEVRCGGLLHDLVHTRLEVAHFLNGWW